MRGKDGGKRSAIPMRMALGVLLTLGTAVLGLGGSLGASAPATQAGLVHAQGASPPATLTFPSVTTTTPAPPTTTATTVAPPAATAAAPAPAPVAYEAPAEPARSASSGDAVLDAIATSFGDVYDQAVAVARCESGLDPNAVSAGGYNWGLFQINVVHKSRVEAMGYSWDQITDPYVNAAVARSIYDDAGGWGPWGCRRAAY